MFAAKLACAALLACAAAGAHAATRGTTLTGTGFSIDSPCAHHVDIEPDPSLHGTVAITATAQHQEELDHLVFETKDRGGKACGADPHRSRRLLAARAVVERRADDRYCGAGAPGLPGVGR